MAMDITTLIFQNILQISPQLMSKYSTLQDQMLYLILIPHIVLLLFIFAFSKGIVGRVIGGHPGFEYLFSLVAYLFFIIGGWYGAYIVPIMIAWFYIGLIAALAVFVLSAVFNPARAPGAMKFFSEAGKKVGDAAGLGKDKAKAAMQNEIDALKDEEKALQKKMPSEPSSRAYTQMQIADIERRIARLEKEKSNL